MRVLKEKACVSLSICHYIVMTIKNFSDLTFEPHANVNNGVQAKLDLGNSLEISVVSMKKKEGEYGGLYGDVTEGTYEVAVFQSNNMLPLNATDDVRGWQTEDDLNELMHSLQGNAVEVAHFIDELYAKKNAWKLELELD